MKKIVLCLIAFIFFGCVSAKSFRVVESRLAKLEKVHQATTMLLVATHQKAKFQDEVNLELAKSMNFLFTQNKWLHDKIFMLSAGVEQDNKDVANLDEKVEKMKKNIKWLRGELVRKVRSVDNQLEAIVAIYEKFKRNVEKLKDALQR
ncbi:MAG: hypothetical protein V1661_01430 [bacterium]